MAKEIGIFQYKNVDSNVYQTTRFNIQDVTARRTSQLTFHHSLHHRLANEQFFFFFFFYGNMFVLFMPEFYPSLIYVMFSHLIITTFSLLILAVLVIHSEVHHETQAVLWKDGHKIRNCTCIIQMYSCLASDIMLSFIQYC
jgi:hypothetical protein